jgi:hypothetical protein
VIVAGIAALTGLQPKGARPVAGTHLMRAARVVLLLLALLFVFIAIRSRS